MNCRLALALLSNRFSNHASPLNRPDYTTVPFARFAFIAAPQAVPSTSALRLKNRNAPLGMTRFSEVSARAFIVRSVRVAGGCACVGR